MTSTFPITTRPCFNLALHEPCPYTSYLFHVSTADTVKLSECEIIFNDNSRRSAELEIAPIPAVDTRPKPVFWQLNFEPYNDNATLNSQDTPAHKLPIFKGYRIQSVNVSKMYVDL